MRSSIILIFALLPLVMISGAAAITEYDSCHVQNLCYNGADMPFCSANDDSCTYTYYQNIEGGCAPVDYDVDSDGDGWSDLCDAFPQNETEWVDYDGDEIGHNLDCNDLDDTVSLECYSSGDDSYDNDSGDGCIGDCSEDNNNTEEEDNNNTEDNDSNSTSNDSDSSRDTNSNTKSHSGRALDNIGEVKVVPNDSEGNRTNETNSSEDTSDYSDGSDEEGSDVYTENHQPNTNSQNLPEKTAESSGSEGSMITGMVTGNTEKVGPKGFIWWLALIVVVAGSALFFAWKKRRK